MSLTLHLWATIAYLFLPERRAVALGFIIALFFLLIPIKFPLSTSRWSISQFCTLSDEHLRVAGHNTKISNVIFFLESSEELLIKIDLTYSFKFCNFYPLQQFIIQSIFLSDGHYLIISWSCACHRFIQSFYQYVKQLQCKKNLLLISKCFLNYSCV